MVRLFTAITLPEEVKDPLLACMGGMGRVRWQTRDQLHLTLRFIGEVEPEMAEEIRLALRTVEFKSFPLKIRDIGLFGNKRKPRLLWAGVDQQKEVKSLYEKISYALTRVGIPPEERKFKAHVTLARFKGHPGKRLQKFLENTKGLSLPPFEAKNFTLFESHLGNSGAHYEPIETYPSPAL